MKSLGIIGCGNISDIYLKNLHHAENCQVVMVADQIDERARAKAEQYGIQSKSVEDLLADQDVFAVINLTIPEAHHSVAAKALLAGKHVYGEKPLALSSRSARELIELSQKMGLRIASAPDTVLGAGIQTARKLIDDGWIGRPVAATAFMTGHGHEGWHPDPTFYYQAGGGPLFDMGPYYLSALFQLLGPVARVTGIASQAFAERIVLSQPRRGEHIVVNTPTHVAGSLEFAAGAVASLVMSFDVWHANLPRIEVYGSEGSLSVPDPNTFGGPVRIRRFDAAEWTEMAMPFSPSDNARGLGVIDLVDAIAQGTMARTDGTIGLHVVEIMEALLESSRQGKHQDILSRPTRPPAMELSGRDLPR